MLTHLNHLPNFRVQIKAFETFSQQRLLTMYYSDSHEYMIYRKREAAARECQFGTWELTGKLEPRA